MATSTKPPKQRSTDELETAINQAMSTTFKSLKLNAFSENTREPDRKLARRTYNAAAWARAYSVIVALNCCIIALIIFWLGETSGRAPRQPAEAAEPETSLLAAPPIETAKPETSSLAVPPIAAPQEAPAPPTEAAEPETSPPAAAPPIETAEPEDLPPTATTIAEPKEAPAPPTEAAEPETSPSAAPTVAAPEKAPVPSAEAHPAGAAPTIASPEEPLATPTPPNAVSTGAQPTGPASRQRTSRRPRRSLNAPRQTTDTWKKGISIFGQ